MDVLTQLQKLAANEALERVNTALNDVICQKYILIGVFSDMDRSEVLDSSSRDINSAMDKIIKDLQQAKKWLEPCAE